MPQDRTTGACCAHHPGLADRTPVLLGGHEHEVYIEKLDGGSTIVKVGADAELFGWIDIWWGADGKLDYEVTTQSVSEWAADGEVQRFVEEKQSALDVAMAIPIATLPTAMSSKKVRFEESDLAKFLLSSVKDGLVDAGVELAMIQVHLLVCFRCACLCVYCSTVSWCAAATCPAAFRYDVCSMCSLWLASPSCLREGQFEQAQTTKLGRSQWETFLLNLLLIVLRQLSTPTLLPTLGLTLVLPCLVLPCLLSSCLLPSTHCAIPFLLVCASLPCRSANVLAASDAAAGHSAAARSHHLRKCAQLAKYTKAGLSARVALLL